MSLYRSVRFLASLALVTLLATAASTVYANEQGPRGTQIVGRIHGPLSVLVLGSGGPAANDDGRASAGYLIFTDGQPRVLMDAGSGTFKNLATAGINVKDLDLVLLSHLHIDHMSDLPAMVKTIYFHARGHYPFPPGRTAPIRIFGPDANGIPFPAAAFPQATAAQYPSTSEFADKHFSLQEGVDRYLHVFTRAIRAGQFDYQAHDVSPDLQAGMRTILSEPDGLVVKAIGVHHGPAPALAYRIEYKGKTLAFSGDTNSQTDNMITAAQGADLLIYDTAIMDDIPDPDVDAVFYALHTTPTRMGQVAATANPRALLLSHITTVTDPRIDQVKRVVSNQGYRGRIIEASDLQVLNLGLNSGRHEGN